MADETSSSQSDPFTRAVDHLRQTAKWAITVFAAVGGVLVAGSQLSSIGRLEVGWSAIDAHRLTVAAIAGIAALLGIGLIIRQAVSVLTTGGGDFNCLTQKERDFLTNTGLLGQYASSESLFAEVQRVNTALTALDPALPANHAQITALSGQLRYLDALVTRAANALRYRTVQTTFEKAMTRMVLYAAGTAAAFVVFVWATNPPDTPQDPPAFRVPVNAVLTLSADDQTRLESTLGPACVRARVLVVVLSTGDGRADVVTREDASCRLARLTVATSDLQPDAPVTLPSPTASP